MFYFQKNNTSIALLIHAFPLRKNLMIAVNLPRELSEDRVGSSQIFSHRVSTVLLVGEVTDLAVTSLFVKRPEHWADNFVRLSRCDFAVILNETFGGEV